MTACRRHLPLLVALLLLLGSVLVAEACDTRAKTPSRFHAPVIVQTSVLQALPDHRTANLRLYTVRSGKLVPIPYRFAARNDDGEFVISQVVAGRDFVFDNDDELIFLAKDIGERVGSGTMPATSDAALEIEVADPSTGERGWVYLLHFPPLTPEG